MIVRLVTLLLALGLLSGCTGGGAEKVAEGPRKPGGSRTTIYFLVDQGTAPLGVRRTIHTGSPKAKQVLVALLAGASKSERARGLTTAIPPHSKLLSLSFKGLGGTDAVADLGSLPMGGSTGVRRIRIITQVTRSLIGVSAIERVWLRSEGRPWGLWTMSGGILDQPHSYRNLGGQVCASKPGTEAVSGDCLTPLP